MPMNTIYLISYPDKSILSVSKNYAINKEGIRQLAIDWYWTGWDEEKTRVEVNVDIDAKTVTVYDSAGNDSITYDIITFKRES